MAQDRGPIAEESDGDDDEYVEPLSRSLYSGAPLAVGGVQLSASAQHAAVKLLSAAYADLMGARQLMGLDQDDEKAFAQEGIPLGGADTYGEMLPEGILDILWRVGAKSGERFYDLGSGAGKAATLAWLVGMRVTGIELARSRWEASRDAVARLAELRLDESLSPGRQASQAIVNEGSVAGLDFVCGNACDLDFTDGDLVFVPSVLFPDWMVANLAATAQRMKPGSRIVSYKAFPGTAFKQVGEISEPTTWKHRTRWLVQEVVGTASTADDMLTRDLRPCNQFSDADRCSFMESYSVVCNL
mmetsp:Transcript_118069/g.333924  ORF Transcript_118069/g.333924 Transcript_118069/m.333924 type:complete len:301 (-) Transcript_118069:7-909(-)